jgi:hypothetical protein
MRYCRYCGGEVSDAAKACGHCGRWLVAEPASRPGPEPVAPKPPAKGDQAESKPVLGPHELRPAPPAPAPEPEQTVGAPATAEDVGRKPPAPPPAKTPTPGLKPKRHVPVAVWVVGAVLIVLMAGAALMMTGAISLTGQHAAEGRATATVAATVRSTRAPAAVSTPSAEPFTVLLGREDLEKTVEAGRPVIVEWVWGVCDPTLLKENTDALDFKVTIDGRVMATGNLAEYRTQLREEELGGLHAWWQHYAYRLGGFESGSSHWFELERGFSQQVTDGCDVDGDGNPDWYGPDFAITLRLHVIVR